MKIVRSLIFCLIGFSALLIADEEIPSVQNALWINQPKKTYNEWLSLDDCKLLEAIGGTPGPMLGCRGSHYSHEICCHGLTRAYEPILYGSTLAFPGLRDDSVAAPEHVAQVAKAVEVTAPSSEEIILKRLDKLNEEMNKKFKAVQDDLLYGRR